MRDINVDQTGESRNPEALEGGRQDRQAPAVLSLLTLLQSAWADSTTRLWQGKPTENPLCGEEGGKRTDGGDPAETSPADKPQIFFIFFEKSVDISAGMWYYIVTGDEADANKPTTHR